MNNQLSNSLIDFVLLIQGTKSEGRTIPKEELEILNSKIGNILPNWYIEMMTTYPLAGCQIEYPLYEPGDGDDGYNPCKIATPNDIFDETISCYPGLAINDLGYFCIGIDQRGSSDPFFTTNKLGDNPPIYQVYHDVSDIGEEIEKHGMVKIADSFSEFFSKAKVRS